MAQLPLILGVQGTVLEPSERQLLEDFQPAGVILFTRNCHSKQQLQDLVRSIRELLGERAPILVDQEGGNVTRLKPPVWPALPFFQSFGQAYLTDPAATKQAFQLCIQAIAGELREIGANMVASPCVDVLYPETHPFLRQRTLSSDLRVIIELAALAVDTFLAAGIQPILKHFPGHGRAAQDSHLSLPVINATRDLLEKTDLLPFQSLSKAAYIMSAHLRVPAFDPVFPSSQSRKTLDFLRQELHFKGSIITDCITMEALQGSYAERARLCLEAGNDLVICSKAEIPVYRTILQMMEKEAPRFNPTDFDPPSYQASYLNGQKISYEQDLAELQQLMPELLQAHPLSSKDQTDSLA